MYNVIKLTLHKMHYVYLIIINAFFLENKSRLYNIVI